MTIVFEILAVHTNAPTNSTLAFQEGINATVVPTLGDNLTYENSESACGLYYKLSQPEGKSSKLISDVTKYIVLSVFLAFNILAAVLCLCIDEVSGAKATDQTSKDEANVSLTSIDRSESQNASKQEITTMTKEKKSPEQQDPSVLKLIKSTVGLLLTDKTAFLLCPFTLNFGMLQAFLGGALNASWITCALGKMTCFVGNFLQ